MTSLPWATIALVHDPLVVALFLSSLGWLLAHYLFRRYPFERAIVRVFFADRSDYGSAVC